jgi:RES domain-containing protein
MIVWRICKQKWAASAFTGVGAAENPGRWNSEGRRAVYCAESRALAAFEILVHTAKKRTLMHAHFVAIPVAIPEHLVYHPTRFPVDWDHTPTPDSTRSFGDRFLVGGKYPAMKVPSVAVKGEFCFLLNPLHEYFAALEIGKAEAFRFDSRVSDRVGQ